MKDYLRLKKKTAKKISAIGVFIRSIKLEWLILIVLFGNLILFLFIFQIALQIRITRLFPTSADTVQIHQFPFFQERNDLIISARSAAVFEKESKVVVYKKNENFRFSPASSAKIMTALVALDMYSPDTALPVEDIQEVKGSKMNLFNGEWIYVIDLLYGLLLPSGNDAAYVLAQNVPGGVDEFISHMNQKAEELHLVNTHFDDPSGYNDKNFTTAYDLARLTSYVLENPVLRKIVATKSKVVYDTSFKIEHKLNNLNQLLSEEGVTGVKTGFTEEAGGVLVTSFVYKNKTFIVVVLKSEDRFSDTREIIAKIVKRVELLTY